MEGHSCPSFSVLSAVCQLGSRLATATATLWFITAEQMIAGTGEGEGVQVASGLADRRIEVDVLDVKHDIASALVRSEPYYEYLHLVRTRDGWKFANALWCTPRSESKYTPDGPDALLRPGCE